MPVTETKLNTLKLRPQYVAASKTAKPHAVQLPIEQYEALEHALAQLGTLQKELAQLQQIKHLVEGMGRSAAELEAYRAGKLKAATAEALLSEL